jgi:predicted Kef-type K+ transport protein
MLDAVVWITVAFALGLAARQLGLPPLVGYLLAGFALHTAGAEQAPLVAQLSDLGVTLLLFTIGLKLKLKSLTQPHVWGVASLHMLGVVAVFVPLFLALGALGMPYLAEIDHRSALLLGFALSFSSTVFAVKVLEEKGEMGSLYGTVAIGILIIQDLAAVLFLALSTGKVPSPWALLLFVLIPLKPAICWVMERAGHGELLLLFGLVLGVGGAELFDLMSIKGDVGALLLGVLIASHPKAGELSKSLLSLKDLFLIGYFLNIGLGGAPELDAVPLVLVLLALVAFKALLFEQLLLVFRLRARTALLGGLTLANYSEFGLIVAAIAAGDDWLPPQWVGIIALALALSFVAASVLNARSHALYELFSTRLRRQERRRRIAAEREIDPGDADAMILGMGRIGTGAYDTLRLDKGLSPVGIDADPDAVARHLVAGRNVVQGSATDADFWHRLHLGDGHIKLVLLAMPQVSENVFAAQHLLKEGFEGTIGAIARYTDDEQVLREAGAHQVFNLYAEAGSGFAQHVCSETMLHMNA